MAISNHSTTTETLLLENTNTVAMDQLVDHNGRLINRSNSGGWRSAYFIIESTTERGHAAGVEVAERFAYFGIASNLITYLTEQLSETTATAAEMVNAWSGTASLLPLLGAFVADSFLGRFRTIVVASLVYILGLGLMTLSALLTSNPPSQLEIISFLFSLYLVAIGQAGHKPCVQAFGADQFDEQNPDESKAKSSFFNWWYFGISIGANSTLLVVIYIQDDLNWALGFGLPCAVMVAALFIFLLGTKTYRYTVRRNDKNPFARIGRVFVEAFKNRKANSSMTASEEQAQSSQQFRFLNKALLSKTTYDPMENGNLCTIYDVEEAKALLRLIPIWATCSIYAILFAQSTTFFTKQGATMDRTIIPGIKIPAASLQVFIGIAIIVFIPIYDCVFVPVTRSLTRNTSGITMLQRIGTGMFLSAFSMGVAALVEIKRLQIAKEYGLIDKPNVTIPMSVWWLVPQYLLFGIADVFTIVGLQEFFYDQIPTELKSFGLSLYLSVIGVGSFLSSILVSIINKATTGEGRESWFDDNLNRAHLDYFYWLLAGLSAVGFTVYLYFAKSYIYNRREFKNLPCNTIIE